MCVNYCTTSSSTLTNLNSCYVFDDCDRFAKWLETNINTDLECNVNILGAEVTGSVVELTMDAGDVLYLTILSPFTSNIPLDRGSYSLIATVTHGTLEIVNYPECAEKVFKYTPEDGYTGTDTFVYWIYGNPPYESIGNFSTINITIV